MARLSCIHKTATSCTPSATIYATVAAWEASINRATNGDETGVICDDVAYAENVTLNAVASGTSIGRLTANDGVLFTHLDGNAAPNVRGDGTFRSGARLDHTAAGELLNVGSNYWVIDHLSLVQRSTTNEHHCIEQLDDLTGLAVINCTFEYVGTSTLCDGIHLINGAHTDVLVNGCSFYNMSRSGIHSYQGTSTGSHTATGNISHCSFYHARGLETAANASAIKFGQRSAAAVTTFSVENCAVGTTRSSSAIVHGLVDGRHTARALADGVVTWNGGYNLLDGSPAANMSDIDETNNMTNITYGDSTAGSTVFTTQTTGEWIVFTNGTAGTADFRPLDDAAGNFIIGNGRSTASIADSPNATIDSWWDTVNGKGTYDKRGYKFNETTPDLGAYSFEDHTVGVDIPFIAQGGYIS